jgi:hypothetical protein
MNKTNLIIPLPSGYRDFISPNLLHKGKESSMKCVLYNNVFTTADPSGRAACLTYTCGCMYSLELLMMDGKNVRNM